MVCCLFVLAMEPWSFFNALAECECSIGCICVVVSFFADSLGLVIVTFGARPHACCSVALHVCDEARCLWLSFVDQWSSCNVLAASECSVECMTTVDTHCLSTFWDLEHCIVCLLNSCMHVGVLHNVLVTCRGTSSFWQWNHGLSSMRLQRVSVLFYARPPSFS